MDVMSKEQLEPMSFERPLWKIRYFTGLEGGRSALFFRYFVFVVFCCILLYFVVFCYFLFILELYLFVVLLLRVKNNLSLCFLRGLCGKFMSLEGGRSALFFTIYYFCLFCLLFVVYCLLFVISLVGKKYLVFFLADFLFFILILFLLS